MTAVRLIPLFVALALAGCVTAASVPMAAPAADADAKMFKPPEGGADVYIGRSSAPSSDLFDIKVDGKLVGPIGPGMFYLVTVNPGRHEISAAAGMTATSVTLGAEAGRNYFYEVTATPGAYMSKPSLGVVLIEEMGKMMIRQEKRAQNAADVSASE